MILIDNDVNQANARKPRASGDDPPSPSLISTQRP